MDFDLSQLDSVRNNSQKLTSSSKFHPKFAAKPVSAPVYRVARCIFGMQPYSVD